ncbi:MAG: Outer membrane lipoprotein omp16 precursor [Cytophagales bacterium]|jgi:outer membrane protein OmpA-like peptidoglycan-associated protein/Tol biopolymer transport system component|nr:PD40 domain-containing protein [Bacteroidota bacterium]MBS1981719.1 PD40 domain-containing protein [Bacteroidota bacterium]WHZ09139.1 MAG: Outer membrane lipoprotein omp16 precursor [Cytophagales bacterium]
MKGHLLLLTLFVLLTQINEGLAQDAKKLAEAQSLFAMKRYDKALPLFIDITQSGSKDPLVHYQTGTCYAKDQNTDNQIKAIPYLEYALGSGKNLPPTLSYDLGWLYLKNEQLDKALISFDTYKKSAKDPQTKKAVDKAIEICHNAIAMMAIPRNFTVHPCPGSINSQYTEYNPTVSADESVIAYTALRPNTGRTRSGDKFIEQVYVSYNQSGSWTEPVVIPIADDKNVGTAGISPDGQKLLIFIGGASDPGSLYQITKDGDGWTKPSLLAGTINSSGSMETTCSITPDGKTIYFASDRVGGKGGLDIWKTELKADGRWGQPVNLGPEINSADNEDAPFIHPDQKTLFFTSDGHNTMGGNDIFKSSLVNGKWTRPENMGYPVNTTANDNYFTLLADGKRGYFSSDRKGGQGAQDIYYIDMPENSSTIPLTMLKGKIINAETGKPIPTKMYVIDKDSKKELEFVYDPDPKTGDYLIILPPSKSYDIVIESEDFLPYTLNVNIPNQTYFYALYQQINLRTIKQFDVKVGQEVSVKNAFYDTQQDVKTDLRQTHESQLVKSGAVDPYDMMIDLMAAKDKSGVDYLVSLIEQTNPVEAVNFNEKENAKIEVASRVYYYDESDESKFEQKQVEGKTVFSLPTMIVTEEAKRMKENQAKTVAYDKNLLAKFVKIFFDQGKSELKDQYTVSLKEILQILNSNAGLGIEISGFASAEGTEEANRELSNKRAIAVLDYFNHQGIVRRRIVAKGYGATKDEKASKEEGRRVEVRVVAVK